MIRVLYRVLLWLHPPGFRGVYGDEMLWLFDRTVAENGATGLLLDALVSVLRQWFLRSRVWLIPVALSGALFTVLSGNALLHFAFRRMVRVTTDTPETRFIFATALAVVMIVFSVMVAVVPVMRARRRA